uniref:Uncharacterized protein n=1 Tax=Mycena chlorophos TaxID=658473 RepID=A0ABQ0LCR3_MYCCL|nr:predicted protein [Mycena chlorophos]
MGRTAHTFTQADKAVIRAKQKALWEKTDSGRLTRRSERKCCSRRHTTVSRLPRLPPLPSQIYIWLKREDHVKSTNKPAFRNALRDDYDVTPIAHWLEAPPFEIPEEYRSATMGSAYRAETQQLVHAVHARRMLALQDLEAARRRLEERGRMDATDGWRNQEQRLRIMWDLGKEWLEKYDAKTQARELAISRIYMHWLAVELDRLHHLKFLKFQ